MMPTPERQPGEPAPDSSEAETATSPSAPSKAAAPSTQDTLVEHAEAIGALAEGAAGISLQSPDAQERVRQLREHVRSFVLPRARSLDAPLVVLLFGPTGSGKSSLANAIAGSAVSPTGALRPTTRQAVVVATSGDRGALLRGPLSELPAGASRWQDSEGVPGIAVVDSPDIDSVETANRELADRLIEAADLAVFVTTATRYADRVPWTVLRRVAERRLPLLVAVNRLPVDRGARTEVLEDVRRLLAQSGLVGADDPSRLVVVPIGEGDVEGEGAGTAIARPAADPLTDRIDRLREDAVARRVLAARSLAGALAGLDPLLQAVADDLEREAIDVDALRREAEAAYRTEVAALRESLKTGLFLRTEVLRRWQDYVGADWLTRSISRGMARVESTVRSALHQNETPVAVRDETFAELGALAESHASEAARRVAASWSETARGSELVAGSPDLWSASSAFRPDLMAGIDWWLDEIRAAIYATGEPKRRLAQGAATGVNAAGVGVMLAVFLHTGGLTGAEMGVAAGTALVNQRLLEAIFGEAAMSGLVTTASKRLDTLLDSAFEREEQRFTSLVPDGSRLRELAVSLRAESGRIASFAESFVETPISTTRLAVDVEREERVRAPSPYPTRSRGLLDAVREFLFGSRVDE